ncbi:halo-CC-star protein HcsL [Halorubrum luteum]
MSDAHASGQGVAADVEPKLRAFLEAIKRSETYREFVEADEQLQDDPDALALLREYQQKRMGMQRGGFDESAMAELRDLRQEMDDDETLRRHRAAQEALVELLQETNDVISEEIGREFAQSTGGGCC